MRDRGVLQAGISRRRGSPVGSVVEEIAADTGLSQYAARVLLEAGLGLASP